MAAPRRDPFDKQIQNRNYLSDVGFKFSLAKAPKVDFFSNTATLPGLSLGVVNQPSYLKEIHQETDWYMTTLNLHSLSMKN